MQVSIDGNPTNMEGGLSYKGMMCRGVPNFSFTLGYTNASWTLKCNLVAEYVCRLLNYMDAHRYDYATPVGREPAIVDKPTLNLTSGYIRRGMDLLPKQGSEKPWSFHQNYALDVLDLRLSAVNDGTMEFVRLPSGRRTVFGTSEAFHERLLR
jgi:monooxygenase